MFLCKMKANVLQRSSIVRYDGSYGTLAAFRLSPARPTDRESTEVRGTGDVLFHEGEDLTLTYREEEGVSVKVEKTGNRLTITRGGAVLAFLFGGVTEFTYRTSYGTLPTEALCEELALQKRGATALLTLTYLAVVGGMAQRNTVRFKITY